ncbi:MAG: hypothetical protein D6729_02330, partial [Deltaproteobacteria bacterium]
MPIHRILGFVLFTLGAAASAYPDWFSLFTGPAPPGGPFQTIERRVRGGMVLGAGLAFLAIPSLRPWSTSLP